MQIRCSVLWNIIILLICIQAYAQGQSKFERDSLEVEQLIKDMRELVPADSIAFRDKVSEAQVLIDANDFKLLKGALLLRNSIFSYNNYQFDLSEKYVDSAQDVFSSLRNVPGLELWKSRALSLKAVFYGMHGDVEKEQSTYLELLKFYESQQDSVAQQSVYANLGNVYFNKNQYDKALLYFSRGYNLAKEQRYVDNIVLGDLNIAMIYNELKNIDSMQCYLDEAWQYLKGMDDISNKKAFYYHLCGQNEILRKNFRKAIEYNKKGLAIAEKLNDTDYIVNNYGGLSTSHYALGQYEEAYMWENKYYESTKTSEKWHYVSVSLKRLADLEQKMGNPTKAYSHLLEYVQLSDSIKEDEITKKLHTLEAEFQSAQKEKEIAQLKYENEYKMSQLQRNNIWMYGSMSVALVLCLLAFLLFRNVRHQKQIHKQQNELHAFQVDQLEQKNKITTLSSLIQGIEQERQRLARDLHDGLGGMLSGIKLKINALTRNEEGKLGEELKQDIDDAINEMRSVSQSLSPDMLQHYGLSEALKQYCSRFNTDHVEVQFQSVNVARLDNNDKELMFYRIAQELINNAIKHANASDIFVQLQQSGQQLFLTVEDNGKGLDVQQAPKGSGLTNLRRRIDFLKGTLDISSVDGHGTNVYISCPV